ncbi:hypothetical protein ScPMuIL_014691 [Solemya velum]
MINLQGLVVWRAFLSNKSLVCFLCSPSGHLPKIPALLSCQKYKSTKSNPVNITISKLNRENDQLFGPLQKPKRKQKLKAATSGSGLNDGEKKNSKKKRVQIHNNNAIEIELNKKPPKKVSTQKDIEPEAKLSFSHSSASRIPRLSEVTKDAFSKNEEIVSWWNHDEPKINRTKKAQDSNISQSERSVPRLSSIAKREMNTNSFTEFPKEKLSILDRGDSLGIMPVPIIPDSLAYVTKCSLSAMTEESEEFLQFRRYVERLALRTMPTVNTIINKTQADMSKFFLQRWREKMIEELGEEGFKVYQENTYRTGIQHHANIQQFLSGKSVSELHMLPDTKKLWDSMDDVLPLVKDVVATETSVTHPSLFYKGTFDCVAVYRRRRILPTLLKSIQEKKIILSDINEKILNEAEKEGVEEEITQTDEYTLDMDLQILEITKKLDSSQTTRSFNFIPPPISSATFSNENLNPNAEMFLPPNRESATNTVSSVGSYYKLPNLTLPSFSGDFLDWQTFWDSYQSSIHNNIGLTDVQKFSYLMAQLQGEASQCIAGLPLTSANHQQAIDPLTERFGQHHKIITACMQSLIDLPSPKNSNGLKYFYDRMETYIRNLQSLGQCQDSYGTLLIPIIIGKLPADVRRNIMRDNGSDKWELNSLRERIRKEICIQEAGDFESSEKNIIPTALRRHLSHQCTKRDPREGNTLVIIQEIQVNMLTRNLVYFVKDSILHITAPALQKRVIVLK